MTIAWLQGYHSASTITKSTSFIEYIFYILSGKSSLYIKSSLSNMVSYKIELSGNKGLIYF
jgi:hypothetical protein